MSLKVEGLRRSWKAGLARSPGVHQVGRQQQCCCEVPSPGFHSSFAMSIVQVGLCSGLLWYSRVGAAGSSWASPLLARLLGVGDEQVPVGMKFWCIHFCARGAWVAVEPTTLCWRCCCCVE
mmetsp:Transcript_22594/g.54870  ORF Transcript_22594/g.54870 Transcript_22594/m.54870 type:complete len:121 (+) Transcript_22594:52-414(+)